MQHFNFMKAILIGILFLNSVVLFSQIEKDKKSLDSLLNTYIDFDNLNYKILNYAIFLKTNEARKRNNLPPLEYNLILEEMAMMHSKDMVNKRFFSHENPYDRNKKTIIDRAYMVGIKNPNIAENIAEAFGLQYQSNTRIFLRGKGKFSYTADGDLISPHTYLSLANQIVDTWLNSPGHKKNILSPSAVQIGCGAWLYFDSAFNFMPSFKITQNFQLYEPIKK